MPYEGSAVPQEVQDQTKEQLDKSSVIIPKRKAKAGGNPGGKPRYTEKYVCSGATECRSMLIYGLRLIRSSATRRWIQEKGDDKQFGGWWARGKNETAEAAKARKKVSVSSLDLSSASLTILSGLCTWVG